MPMATALAALTAARDTAPGSHLMQSKHVHVKMTETMSAWN